MEKRRIREDLLTLKIPDRRGQLGGSQALLPEPEEMGSGWAREGLDWMSGKNSSPKWSSGSGSGCPWKLWSPHPCRDVKAMWMPLLGTWFIDGSGSAGGSFGFDDLRGLLKPR